MNDAAPARWDSGLTGAARRIAASNHSPLRVLAGPGTGKTFSLMRRVARLLQEGADPRRILVSTFTRTAANDLQRELARLGIPGADEVRAGTLHSYCFSLLNRADVLALTRRVPRPLLDLEVRFLLEDLKSRRLGNVRTCRRRLLAFNAAWARLQSDDPGWPSDAVDRAFQSALLCWLRFHQAMLIGELVPQALDYLRDNPASPYRRAFDHVLVDEYQDLNRAEQVLLELLAEDATLSIVGDQDQSIYMFKYAHPEGTSEFGDTHPGTHDELLRECRRCPQRVVAMATALIENNETRAEYPLLARRSNPSGEVHVVQWPELEDEAHGIAQFIDERLGTGEIEPGNVLVLAPRRQFGYAIRDQLLDLGVEAQSFFAEQALDGNPKHIAASTGQQRFTLLTLLAKPDDRVALRCWSGFGNNSLCKNAWDRLRDHCETAGASPNTALELHTTEELRLPHMNYPVERFRELQEWRQELEGVVGQNLVDALFPEEEEWAEPFRQLAESIEEDDFDAEALRDVLLAGITQPELPTDVDYVRVMSLHKSKGLTADLVVVVGCLEGLIPFIDDDLTPAEQAAAMEEQRRLFYVAITRTRSILVLSSITRLPRDIAYRMRVRVTGGNRTMGNTIASGFLRELGSERPRPVSGYAILRG